MPNNRRVAKLALMMAAALGSAPAALAESPCARAAAAAAAQAEPTEGSEQFFQSLEQAATQIWPESQKKAPPKAVSTKREDYEVVVFTDDAEQGAKLVDVLKLRGYTQARIDDSEPNKPSNIKWGMAQPPMIDDILGVMQSMFDVDPDSLERRKEWHDGDDDIFININFGTVEAEVDDEVPLTSAAVETATEAAADKGPADFEVVVFTDDQAKGAKLVTALQARGYTQARLNPGTPNKPSNIKWGMAKPAMVDDVLDVLQDTFAVDPAGLERRKEWADDDNDIFVNINFNAATVTETKPAAEATLAAEVVEAVEAIVEPAVEAVAATAEAVVVSPEPAARTGRAKYDVVVFANDKKKAAEVVAKLQALGYSEASVNSGKPNPSSNIKWGMADQATIDEILALLESDFGIAAKSMDQKHIWPADDEDLFLNLHF